MYALIGRHGGHGGHGGGGRGGRGGRRFFGGGGGGWGWGGWPLWSYPYPYPYPYGWPQQPYGYYDVESSETVGAVVDALSFGVDGITCEMDLGPDLWLRVAIIVGGRRHETAVDLSGVLCDIAESVVRTHGQYGGSPPAAERAMRDMTSRTARAVESAGTLLVGALYEKHAGEISAGLWDSFTSVMSKVSTPVTWFHKQVAKVIQKVPGLKQAVTVAATAVATAYGGPAAGAAASQLTGPLIDRSAETGGDIWADLRGTKEQAHKQSGGDPKVARAIDHAGKAITQTVAAYTLKDLVARANAGDPDAAGKIAEIQRAAQTGDPAAVKAYEVLMEVQRSSGGQLPPPPQTDGALSFDGAPSSDGTAVTSGAWTGSLSDLRELALSSAARTRATHGGGEAVVFVLSPRHGQFAIPVSNRLDAVRYLHRVDPRGMSYIAVVDVSDPSSPFFLAERSFPGESRGGDSWMRRPTAA